MDPLAHALNRIYINPLELNETASDLPESIRARISPLSKETDIRHEVEVIAKELASDPRTSEVALAQLHNLLEEETPIPKDAIKAFVANNHLFSQVRNKKNAVTLLIDVQKRSDFKSLLSNVVAHLNKSGDLLENEQLMKDPDIDHVVVLAYMSGQITQNQLGTYFFHKSVIKSATKEFPIEKVPLFLPNGEINPKAADIVAKMKPDNIPAEKIGEWFARMKTQMPPSEQYLFVEKRNRLAYGKGMDITDRLIAISRFLVGYSDDSNHYRVYPSFEIVNQWFETEGKFVDIAVCFAARKNNADNGATGVRDVVVRNPYQLTSTQADSFPAKGPSYTVHDLCFHCKLVNTIPPEHQKIFSAMAIACKDVNLDEFPEVTPDLLFFNLCDMEFTYPSKHLSAYATDYDREYLNAATFFNFLRDKVAKDLAPNNTKAFYQKILLPLANTAIEKLAKDEPNSPKYNPLISRSLSE